MKNIFLLFILVLLRSNLFGQCSLLITYTATDYQCTGGSAPALPIMGTIEAHVQNGTPPYTYQLNTSGFQTDSLFDNLYAGIYTLYVKDASNCLDSIMTIVNQPPQPIINNVVTTSASCAPGCDGVVNIQASGGTPPFQYSISSAIYGQQIQSSGLFNSVCAETYSVIVIDANGCEATSITSVSSVVFYTISIPFIKQPSCVPGNDGEVVVSGMGSNSNFQFSIMPIVPSMTIVQDTIKGLTANTYTIVATETSTGCNSTAVTTLMTTPPTLMYSTIANDSCLSGCKGSIQVIGTNINNFQITGPGNPSISSTGLAQNLCGNASYTVLAVDMAQCTAMFNFNVGIDPTPLVISNIQSPTCIDPLASSIIIHQYSTSPNVSFSFSPNVPYNSNNDTIIGLPAGTYTITATNSINNCSTSAVITIHEPERPNLVAEELIPSICDLPNGGVKLKVVGGTLPYIFSSSVGMLNEPFIYKLASGTYTCAVIDSNHCADTLTYQILDSAPDFFDSVATMPTSCAQLDGSIWIATNPSFPNQPFSFSLDKLSWYVGSSFQGLGHGLHKVYAKSYDGCIDSTTALVGFKDSLLLDNLVVQAERCGGANDGRIILPKNNWHFSILPLHEIDFTNRIISNLPFGTYTVTAIDAQGCSGTTMVYINKANALQFSLELIKTTYGDCHGEIQMTASGGIPPYTYHAEPSNFAILSDSGKLLGLCNTTYDVIVTDSVGCQQMQQIFIPYKALENQDFYIYPNPSSQLFQFVFARNVDVVITLTDLAGRTVLSNIYTNKNKINLPIQHLASGIYLATLNLDDQKFIRKLEVKHE